MVYGKGTTQTLNTYGHWLWEDDFLQVTHVILMYDFDHIEKFTVFIIAYAFFLKVLNSFGRFLR